MASSTLFQNTNYGGKERSNVILSFLFWSWKKGGKFKLQEANLNIIMGPLIKDLCDYELRMSFWVVITLSLSI